MEYSFWIVTGLLALIVLFALWVLWRAGKRRFSERERAYMRSCWNDAYAVRTQDPKTAILEADKVLDYALTMLKYRGTLGDKLKEAESLFHDINAVWSAHKLRNRIAHEMQFVPTAEQALEALQSFERALKDLKAL